MDVTNALIKLAARLDEATAIVDNLQAQLDATENRVRLLEDKKLGRMSKPTIEELNDYVAEKKLVVDVDKFYNYYEANGWMIGRTKMKSWKAALSNWSRRNTILGHNPQSAKAAQMSALETLRREAERESGEG